MSEWLDRAEAMARLGVRAQTLYAYVSRGLIGMQPDPVNPRRSLYRVDDVNALSVKRARGRRASAVAQSVMSWGEPAIATSISTTIHGRLIYYGKDAVTFSEKAGMEETAALLWDTHGPITFSTIGPVPECDCRTAAFLALSREAASGRSALGRGRSSLCEDATRAISVLAVALGATVEEGPIHKRLAEGWSVGTSEAELLRQALVLLADHELNASTFAARVAGSTGAPIAACLLAGLATLSGPRHGGVAVAVAAMADDASRVGIDTAIGRWLIQDRPLPGFGHPLYPDGDPRAAELLRKLPIDNSANALSDAITSATGIKPNIDFALYAISKTFRLPADAPFRLFALGRSIGWAAHAMEQIATNNLIRPRARYEGPRPSQPKGLSNG